ncbi:MAG: MotA/TolQ/ExbB proton channel family protein [Candidatus Competibacteraceae bacterium]|nr:MotA/TolQ/ExbB proton channel family protein [Candidatus Competibacteraceae bacterium]
MHYLLQITMGTDSAAASNPPIQPAAEETSIQVIDMAIKGGWIMIPLAIMSIIAIYIFIERFFAINKAGKEDVNFMNNIRDFILNGKLDAALSLCKATQSPISRMIEKGVSRIGRPLDDISASIENTAKLEVYKLEKSMALLATISGAAPMLGFLGTVVGMIKALFVMANSGEGVVINSLAGGIYEAMVTTVGGLTVGIIAYVGYNILVSKVEKVIYKMEARSIEFLDLLNEPGK